MSKNIFIIFIFIKLNSKLSNYAFVKSYSQQITLSGGYAWVDIKNIALSGYTAVGIIQCSFSSSWMSITNSTIKNYNEITISVRDIGSPTSSTVTVTAYIDVLYIKNL